MKIINKMKIIINKKKNNKHNIISQVKNKDLLQCYHVTQTDFISLGLTSKHQCDSVQLSSDPKIWRDGGMIDSIEIVCQSSLIEAFNSSSEEEGEEEDEFYPTCIEYYVTKQEHDEINIIIFYNNIERRVYGLAKRDRPLLIL